MRARILTVALVLVLLLGAPVAAPSQVIITCGSFTLLGDYVATLGGVDARGDNVTRLLFLNFQSSNAQGLGQYTGTMYVNPRGKDRTQVNIFGNYQIFVNCMVHIFIADGSSINTVSGFLTDFGEQAVLSSAFDPEAQLTGTLKKIR